MNDERDLRQSLAFERWWDRLIRGKTADHDPDLDPGLEAFARRVHARDEQPSADPAFKRQLWEDLMNAQPAKIAFPAPVFGPNGRQPRPPTPAKTRPAIPPRREPGRASRGLSFAATVALVVAVLAMIFFIYHNGQPAVVPPVQETPTAVPTQTAPATGDWPTIRGDPGRTGATDQPGPTGQFAVLWTFTAPDGLNAPMLAGSTVYIASNTGIVYALAADTGQQRWAFDMGSASPDPTVYPFPTVGQTLVYATSYGGTIYALNRGDGAVRWSFQAAGQLGNSAALVGDTLYLADDSGAVYALDAVTGDVRWTATVGQPLNGLPAVVDGIVYQGGVDGGLFAFDAATGTMLWSTSVGGQVRAPAVVGGYAYFSSYDGTLYALDAKTGAERWRYTPSSGAPASPAVAGGAVVFNVQGVGTVALDAESGAPIWEVPFEASNWPPAIASGVVYVSDGTSQILAFDPATGQQVGGATMASPPGLMAIAGGVLYVADLSGTLTAFATGSATPVSQAAVAPTQPVQPSPTPDPAGVQATHLWTAHLGQDAIAAIAFPPDGTVWVQDYGGKAWILDRDGNLLDTWGTPGQGPGELTFKVAGEASWFGDVAFAPDGSFFVAECGNSRVEKFDAQRNLVLSIGTRGRDNGQFLCPTGVVVGADGDIFVADNGRNDIQRFAPDGTFLGNLGTFAYPVDLTLDGSGNLVFGEINAGRVRVIAPDGTSVLSVGTPGSTPGQLLWPNQIAVDEAGNFYVSDGRASYVSVFAPTGAFLGTVGSEGSGDGQFDQGITAVGYGGNGSLYVTDLGDDGSGTFRVQKFKVTVTAPAAATPVA